ncbi:protein adenylyltransferase SelO [uncultured Rhodoferax sp.]|uniref:protein adenylyltransferase SelO n=1 Tax=uncultured Rhodoferax sp. TaxID=223188 RepID=UPI0025F8735C|nr:YdiU family protein [uncultured Rhodoferax sp.]
MPISSYPGDPLDVGLAWNHRFASLGEDFFTPLSPSPLPAPYWAGRSTSAAHALGLDPAWLQSSDALQAFSGNRPLQGGLSLASVYSGHQFGVWAGQLGDGRAILLGDANGWEIQLKGAGLTPYSRMGDGRAVLRSSIREFLASEAMHALGIPTSRALCVTGSPAPVRREEIETAAVVTRLAPSFIRFGHFEHFCHHGLHDQLKVLADFVIDQFYPACRTDARWGGNPYVSLLAAVTERTAEMVAQWQAVGFCHGVMNTDNMSILGLTIDYGPFQFMDAYDPDHICNHSDHQGRYAFYKQPNIAYWNLFCLGQALMPLIDAQEDAIAALEIYKDIYPRAVARRMAAKLGFSETAEAQVPVIEGILKLLAADKVDFTIFWRRLSLWVREQRADDDTVRDLFLDRAGFDAWLLSYSELLAQIPRGLAADLMQKTNPAFVLRNHLGEEAIQAARAGDFTVVADLLKVLERPYDEHPEHAAWADFPPDWANQIAISCSS